jgi:hypothetical protein
VLAGVSTRCEEGAKNEFKSIGPVRSERHLSQNDDSVLPSNITSVINVAIAGSAVSIAAGVIGVGASFRIAFPFLQESRCSLFRHCFKQQSQYLRVTEGAARAFEVCVEIPCMHPMMEVLPVPGPISAKLFARGAPMDLGIRYAILGLISGRRAILHVAGWPMKFVHCTFKSSR